MLGECERVHIPQELASSAEPREENVDGITNLWRWIEVWCFSPQLYVYLLINDTNRKGVGRFYTSPENDPCKTSNTRNLATIVMKYA